MVTIGTIKMLPAASETQGAEGGILLSIDLCFRVGKQGGGLLVGKIAAGVFRRREKN